MNFKEALIAHLQGEKVEVFSEWTGYDGIHSTAEWREFGKYYETLQLEDVRLRTDAERVKYRLKPRTITVNGREVQAGETKAPELQSEYFLPHVSTANRYASEIWYSSEFDLRVLDDGLVHLTKEAAIAHAKAMLNID